MRYQEHLTFVDGKLYDEDGQLFVEQSFENEDDADQWLIDNDVRATITVE